MSDPSPPDPTKEPEFQKVIRHFVTTPRKPHETLKRKKEGLHSEKPTGAVQKEK
jgi:hypothetical protein